MDSFTISFRIADETIGSKTYDERYQALVDAIKACVPASGKYWDQSTAFFAIQAELSADQIAVKYRAAIATSTDLVLILGVHAKVGRIVGKNDDKDIFTIIDYLKTA